MRACGRILLDGTARRGIIRILLVIDQYHIPLAQALPLKLAAKHLGAQLAVKTRKIGDLNAKRFGGHDANDLIECVEKRYKTHNEQCKRYAHDYGSHGS